MIPYNLTDIPYTLDDVHLASLISNIKQPNADAQLAPRTLQLNEDFTFRHQKNFKFVYDLDASSSVTAQLTRLLTLAALRSKSDKLRFESAEGRIYELSQPRKLFQEFCSDPEVRKWILQQHDDGEDVFFVCGLRTFTDVSLVDEAAVAKVVSGSVNAPVGTVAALAGGLPGAQLLDSKVGGGVQSREQDLQSSSVPGERIYAVSFRKVSFKWFSGDEMKGANLARDNCWTFTMGRRGETTTVTSAAVEEAVEVDLGEDEEFVGAKSQGIKLTGEDEGFLVASE